MKTIDALTVRNRLFQLFCLGAAILTGLIARLQFHWSNLNYAILLTTVLAYFVYSRALPLGSRRGRTGSFVLSLVYTFLYNLSRAGQILSGAVSLSSLLSLCFVLFGSITFRM